MPLLSELAAKLRASGHEERARTILERAAASEGKALADVVRVVDALCKGDLAPVRREVVNATTIKAIGDRWTSGELAREYPDHVRAKRSDDDDAERLALHIFPVVGDIPIGDFTIDDAEAVMRAIPEGRARITAQSRAIFSSSRFADGAPTVGPTTAPKTSPRISSTVGPRCRDRGEVANTRR